MNEDLKRLPCPRCKKPGTFSGGLCYDCKNELHPGDPLTP